MRALELIGKEVINIKDGCKLGYVSDFTFDEYEGNIKSIIVVTKAKFFGLFGGSEEYLILWEQIEKLSCDVVLVCFHCHSPIKKSCNFFNR